MDACVRATCHRLYGPSPTCCQLFEPLHAPALLSQNSFAIEMTKES